MMCDGQFDGAERARFDSHEHTEGKNCLRRRILVVVQAQ
jgi:hypothetical protein